MYKKHIIKISKNIIFLVVICLGLTACFGYTELYKDSNGQQIYRATCKRDITKCYEIAGDVCEEGFVLMEWYGKRSYTNLDEPGKLDEAKKQDLFGVGNGRMVFRCE